MTESEDEARKIVEEEYDYRNEGLLNSFEYSKISMVRYLEADLHKSVPWFTPHPVTKEDMVKLVKNILGDYGVLYDGDDNPIE